MAMAPPQASDGMVRAGDVDIFKVELHSSQHNSPYDLSLVWTNIAIFEDIEKNYIAGELTLTDTQNIIMDAPIIGGEKITIEFKTRSAVTTHVTVGQVVGIPSHLGVRQGLQLYVLKFISAEFVRNQNLKFSKAYNKMLISDMVVDIYAQYIQPINNKPIIVIPTVYIDSKVVPTFSPFRAINWLARWAQAPNYRLGASYVFFETQHGYYFGPIEGLVDEEINQQPAVVYSTQIVHGQEEASKNIARGFYNITDISIQFPDHLEKITEGMYAAKLLSHDLVTRTCSTTTLNYFDSFLETKHLNTALTEDTTLHSHHILGEYADVKIILNADHSDAFGGGVGSGRSSTILVRNSQMNQYNAIQLEISVPGDSDRTVGEMIDLRLPSYGTSTLEGREGEQDKYLSGRYLIGSLRHNISRSDQSARAEYALKLGVIKDTYKTPLPEQQVVHWR